MNKDKVNVPKVRFPGFTEPWEQRKFEDIFKLSQGLQIPISQRFLTEGANKYFYITNEFLKSTCDEKYYIENPPQSVICNKEDILMTRTGNTGIVVTDVEGCFHNNFFKIQYDKELLDKYFIVQLLSTESMKRRILNSAGSSTIPDLSHKSFYKLDSIFPKIDEQKKISEFILRLDKVITIHQRKLNHLQQQKKGFLQKMFPKNGESFPKLRFPGFTEPWEQCTINELADRYDNLRVPITALDRVAGSTPYYGANGIQDYVEGFTHDGEFILVAEDGASDLQNYPVQYVNGKVWVNNHAHVLQAKSEIADNKFLMNAMKHTNIEPYLVGGGRAKLNADVMMKISFRVPVLAEQKQIGSFFVTLDQLITLHQRKLEHLQQQKKGLLQQMFV